MTSSSPERPLIAATAVNSLGDGAFQVTFALYVTQVVGLSPARAALVVGVAWTLGFLASTPVGRLADRVGQRRAAVGLSLGVAAALAGAVLAPAVAFPAVFAAYAVAQSGLGAVRQALVAVAVPADRRVEARARLHVAVNGGMGVGAALGGVALLAGAYPVALLADAATFLAAAVLLARVRSEVQEGHLHARSGHEGGLPEPGRAGRRALLRDRRYVAAAALNAVLYLYMPLLTVALPLHLAAHTLAPAWTVALVFVVNTAGVLALQVRAARTVTSLTTAATALRRAGLGLFAACAVWALAAGAGSPGLALAVVGAGALVQVLAEVFLAAGSWQAGFALADPARPGAYQGLWTSGVPLARAAGPAVLVAVLVDWSGPGWLVLGGVFALAALLLARTVGRAAAADEVTLSGVRR